MCGAPSGGAAGDQLDLLDDAGTGRFLSSGTGGAGQTAVLYAAGGVSDILYFDFESVVL